MTASGLRVIPHAMKNLIGKRYGKLVVIKFLGRGNNGKRYYWECKCDCGKTTKTGADHFNRVRSCGECLSDISHTKLYYVWKAMLGRCENPKDQGFHHYGGRGITVCEEWHDCRVFYNWAMKHGYREGLTLDRKNNDGPYSSKNCRFVTMRKNVNNRRTTIWIEHDGQRRTLVEWAAHLGLKENTLYHRVKIYKWPLERALRGIV